MMLPRELEELRGVAVAAVGGAELLGGVEEALSSTWAAGTSNGFGSGVEKGAEADEVAFSGVVAGVVEQLLARR